MTSQRGKANPWQFKLTTILQITLVVAWILANLVPRFQTTEFPAGFVVRQWHRGFPFIYATDVESQTGSYGTRNLAALAGDIMIGVLVIALFSTRHFLCGIALNDMRTLLSRRSQLACTPRTESHDVVQQARGNVGRHDDYGK